MGDSPRPGPKTTLVVILGASKFPKIKAFKPNPAFKASAEAFRDYLLDSKGFGLPETNLLYLFDTDLSPMDVDDKIAEFLQERIKNLKAIKQPPLDVLVYYVGHGGFTNDSNADYFLTLSNTGETRKTSSGYLIRALATNLKGEARHLRKYLILDCCFSAVAYKTFQSAPIQGAVRQTLEQLPTKGTALLCAASKNEPAKALPNYKYTMFSTGLLKILKDGDPENSLSAFSFRDLGELIEVQIKEIFGDEAIRPEVHSPDQRQGDVAEIPFFPNIAICQPERRTKAETYKIPVNPSSKQLQFLLTPKWIAAIVLFILLALSITTYVSTQATNQATKVTVDAIASTTTATASATTSVRESVTVRTTPDVTFTAIFTRTTTPTPTITPNIAATFFAIKTIEALTVDATNWTQPPRFTDTPTIMPTSTTTPTVLSKTIPSTTPTPNIVIICNPPDGSHLMTGETASLAISVIEHPNFDWTGFDINWFATFGIVKPINIPITTYTAPYNIANNDEVRVEIRRDNFITRRVCTYNILTPTPTPTLTPTPTEPPPTVPPPTVPPLPEINFFNIHPREITKGVETATLSWNVFGETTSIRIRNKLSTFAADAPSIGEKFPVPAEEAVFELKACNFNQCTTREVRLHVVEPSPTPIPTPTPVPPTETSTPVPPTETSN